MTSKRKFSIEREKEPQFPVDMDFYLTEIRKGKDYIEIKTLLKERETLDPETELFVLKELDEAIVEEEYRQSNRRHSFVEMAMGALVFVLSFCLELLQADMGIGTRYFIYAAILGGIFMMVRGFRKLQADS